MELTVESALSAGGIVGHLSYLLLVVSMIMRRIGPLRMFAIASAVAGISYDVIWLKDPIGVFWESLLLSVNVFQLALIKVENRRARFSDEEVGFRHRMFPGMNRGTCRRVLNKGFWITGEAETTLTTEGEPVPHLIFLASGEARIVSGGKVVAACGPGAFIGELTVLTGEPATGTAILSEESRYWAIEAATLRALVKSDLEIGQSIQTGFALNLRDKLLRSGRAVVDSDGPA